MTEENKKRGIDPASSEQAERLHEFAHDIRNRLTGLWETMRVLNSPGSEGMDRSELNGYVERAYFNAQSDVEALLDDFAVDRRISVGPTAPFDRSSSLKNVIALESYRLEKKDQRISITDTAGMLSYGDVLWYERIVQALISNASKFSPRGSMIEVTVEDTNVGSSVTVKDLGVGLNTDDLLDVFTRYAILSSRSTDGEPQARATLSRAIQWAHALGGTLQASSNGQGQGSAFTLSLPKG